MRAPRRLLASSAFVAVGIAAAAAAALAGDNNSGFHTSQPSMLTTGDRSDVTFKPIATVGETLPGGTVFESVPDGIALRTRGQGRVDVYVNHETSTVPFPYTPSAPTESNSQNDFRNAEVSMLALNQHSAGVLTSERVISSEENFQRFCSNFLAWTEHGFDRAILFTNEEAVDWVNRSGKAWPATIGSPAARQAGLVVAHDVKSGDTRAIWGMGRHNHENTVAIPGFDELVLLSGDDTFTSSPSQSQLYSYIAEDTDAVWNDEGSLWAFVSNDPAYDEYEDFLPGSATSVSGRFIEVPRMIATGVKADGTELMSSDVGFPAPPNDGTWQRDPNGVGVDGPQWVLEYWSKTNGVFRFVRVEDLAYDKRPGMDNVVYIADSGRGTAGASQARRSTNGRIWKMVLDPSDPRTVTSLSIFVEGDDNPVKTLGEVHQPDNLETTPDSLLITEDPGSSQQFTQADAGLPNATTARLWRVPLAGGAMEVVAKVDQSADEGPTDVDATTSRGNLGAWESSGVVDASAAFGPGAFLMTVQAGTLWVDKAPGDDNVAPAGPDFTYKRSGGQLVLIRVPGA
jgi:hypothetical protein